MSVKSAESSSSSFKGPGWGLLSSASSTSSSSTIFFRGISIGVV